MSSAELYRILRAWTQERFDGQLPTRVIIETPTTVCTLIIPAPGNDPPKALTHSPDFRSVSLAGVVYEFTTKQAQAVACLCHAAEAGAPSVSQEAVLEEIDSDCGRLRDLFRDHAAWGKLIIPGETRGSYRLAQ